MPHDFRAIAQALFNSLVAFYPEGAEHAVGCSEKLHAKATNPRATRCKATDAAIKQAEAAGFKPQELCPCCHRVMGEHGLPPGMLSGPAVPLVGQPPVGATPAFVRDSGGADAEGNSIVGFGSLYGKN